MTKPQGAVFAEIKANMLRLDVCKRHHFPDPIPGLGEGVGAMFGQRLRCHNCDGMMPLAQVGAYVRGFEAAGGDPNSVVPGWRDDTN